jgi:SsrA-binding protein
MATKKSSINDQILHNILTNKKAYFEFSIEETFVAGIVLQGTEVKSLRNGKCSFLDTFCVVEKGEVFIRNFHINEYSQGTYNNHTPNRARKLLLEKREIRKMKKKLEEKGYTLVALQVFFNHSNLVKVHIGLGKGKKLYDKRDDAKEKDAKREVDRHFSKL